MTVDPADLIESVEKLSPSAELSDSDKAEVLNFARNPSSQGVDKELIDEKPEPVNPDTIEGSDLRTQLASMGLPGKVKLALFGNGICRAILIRDANKMVQQFVLKNPKITLKEIEDFSKNQHLSDFVLRTIADSKTWMKSGLVKYNIVTNAKTPPDIALKWLKYLQPHEIKKIAKSKNIPQLIATTAKKLAVDIRT